MQMFLHSELQSIEMTDSESQTTLRKIICVYVESRGPAQISIPTEAKCSCKIEEEKKLVQSPSSSMKLQSFFFKVLGFGATGLYLMKGPWECNGQAERRRRKEDAWYLTSERQMQWGGEEQQRVWSAERLASCWVSGRLCACEATSSDWASERTAVFYNMGREKERGRERELRQLSWSDLMICVCPLQAEFSGMRRRLITCFH